MSAISFIDTIPLMSKNRNSGFTLVELLISVAIVGILAAIALPEYKAYVTRSKVTELIAATAPCRARITELYQTGDRNEPGPVSDWGCEFNVGGSKYVNAITTNSSGTITVQPQNIPEFQTFDLVILSPMHGSLGSYWPWHAGTPPTSWRCSTNGAIMDKYLPSSCRD